MTTQLTGRDLDRAIAELCGWRHRGSGYVPWAQWYKPDGSKSSGPPHYHESVDALKEVERRLREAGWTLEVSIYPDKAVALWSNARFLHHDPHIATTEAEARAQAVYTVLLAMKEQS